MTLNKDLVAGLIFILVGLIVVIEAQHHPLGTLLRMGPGYYPTITGSLTVVFGIALVAKAIIKGGPRLGSFAWQELVLLIGSIVVFALALERLGLILSIVLIVFISRLSHRPVRWVETVVLAAALAVLGTGIFWWFLKLPVELWP